MAEPAVRLRVAACVCDAAGRMLLVQHEKDGLRYWLAPGGGVEPGETLLVAVAREVQEETGYAVAVGRLVLLCEAIEPGGRHIVNLFFAGRVTAGELTVGSDRRLCDASWLTRDAVATLVFLPPIKDELLAAWDEGFEGPVRVLGNVWQPLSAPPLL